VPYGMDAWSIVLNGEEPMWLTPHQRDLQPDGQRERKTINVTLRPVC